ncbi:ras guanine nucleotide exchange factor domain-containing protein [Gamsiella multidivaricata]|uniref:ras guanine nucleotide exchange factor domain-containing protein n=1 Tax=Gamsiella multidivaricata TaxID=101098 RepID=UPI00221EC633|nr:ras guanine nucleotide exchange factor domain-containing protein [Gamsiella multidivaricata]KAI7816212.1 ras guanine nucleotide exchange factor domain-containing protein [Gamsiella multidivaricata]
MFIVSALISTPVRRLNLAWRMVSSRDMETLRRLEKLLDPSGNMRNYRQAISEVEALPVIPFLPILLKDITFILDGNPTMIASKFNPPGQTPPVSGGSAHAGASQVAVNDDESSGSVSKAVSLPSSGGGGGNDISSSNSNSNNNSSGCLDSKADAEGPQLVNFDKFRRLTQYVENAVDMAKSVDYWFEPQLLRQARVFRPTSPSLDHGGHPSDLGGSVEGSVQTSRGGGSGPFFECSSGPLDKISEIVEHRLVKASGLYGVHQRVIEVEFTSKPKSTGLWKGGVSVGGVGVGGSGFNVSLGGGGGGSSGNVHGSTLGETVIRAVQGEEEYLMGLSLMCEPGR